jgi:hypothetical protein
MSVRMKCWLGVALLTSFSAMSSATSTSADVGVDDTIAFVEIANSKDVARYRVGSSNDVLRVKQMASQATNPAQELEGILTSLRTKQTARKQAAASIGGHSNPPLRWADVSPDNGLVFAGVQDPSMSAATAGTISRYPGIEPLMRIESPGRICDAMWSQDSRSIAVLEVVESMKRTPWGLLAALSGHPIELQTFYLRLINVDKRSEVRVKVAEDVENGAAEVRSRP